MLLAGKGRLGELAQAAEFSGHPPGHWRVHAVDVGRNLAQEDLARTHPFDAHDINLALAVREEVVVDNDLAALDVPEVGPHEALSDIRPAHGGMVPVAD